MNVSGTDWRRQYDVGIGNGVFRGQIRFGDFRFSSLKNHVGYNHRRGGRPGGRMRGTNKKET